MSIRVICGHIGQGKTLYALSLLGQAVEAGRPTFTNIRLVGGPYADRVGFLDDDECLVCGEHPRDVDKKSGKPRYEAFWHYLPKGSVVVIDEADWYFDCGDFSRMGKDVRQYHKQVRKLGHDLIYIVQHVPNLYVRIRRLVTSFVVCEWNYRTSRLFEKLPIGWSRFLRSEFSADDFSPRNHTADGFWTYSEGAAFFPWYRTDQMLGDVSFYRAETLRELGITEDQAEASKIQVGGGDGVGQGFNPAAGVGLGGVGDGIGGSALAVAAASAVETLRYVSARKRVVPGNKGGRGVGSESEVGAGGVAPGVVFDPIPFDPTRDGDADLTARRE